MTKYGRNGPWILTLDEEQKKHVQAMIDAGLLLSDRVTKLEAKLSALEAKHRKCPWVDGDDIVQGEHEADVGSIGMTFAGIDRREARKKEHPVGVVTLLLSGEQVWLAKRCAENRAYCGLLAAPGGSLEEGEEPPFAAQRETAEETGLDIALSRFNYGGRTEHTYDNGKPFSMHWFYVQLDSHEIPICIEPHKQGEWALHNVNSDLKAVSTPGTWEALERL